MEIIIKGDDVGKRLDFLVSEIYKETSLSRSIIQKHLNKGCLVNGKICKRSYKLRESDTVVIDEKYWEEIEKGLILSEEIVSQKGDLDIRYEDEDLIVLNKPKGLIVHPGVGNREKTLANYVRYYLESKNKYDESVERCGIVHRLDKGVSGLMMVAKNRGTQEYLKGEFKKNNVLKIYYAQLEESINIEQKLNLLEYVNKIETESKMWEQWQKVEGYIGRDRVNRYKMEFRTYEFAGSKYALSYILFSKNEALIKIDTGRMHQIRATLKYLGYHIQGDSLYGKGSGDKIMLESVLLSFKNQDGLKLTITL